MLLSSSVAPFIQDPQWVPDTADSIKPIHTTFLPIHTHTLQPLFGISELPVSPLLHFRAIVRFKIRITRTQVVWQRDSQSDN